MSVQVIDNFSYKGKKGNFERDNFDTLQAMRSYPEDGIDDGHVCFCNEDGNHYKFNHLNSVDGATGRWRLHNKSVNTLTETGEGKVLDARQGKILKDLIDAKVIEAGGVSFDTVPTKGSTNPVTSNGIKEAMDEQAESINSNMGVDDYPVFSASEAYSKGKVVNYNGKLYKFTADHAAGAWIGTDVEETSMAENSKTAKVYLEDLDTLFTGSQSAGTVATAMEIMTGLVPTVYDVIYVIGVRNLICGKLFVYSDNSGHVITQVLFTSMTLDDNGALSGAHTDGITHMYYRTYGVMAPSLANGKWTEWKQIVMELDGGTYMQTLKPDNTPKTSLNNFNRCENHIYFASTPGTYTKAGNIVVEDGELALILWSWRTKAFSKETIYKTDIVQEIGNSENAVMSQKAVTEKINNINSKVDLFINDAKIERNTSSNIFSNRVNIYSNYFKIKIVENTIQTTSGNLSLAVTKKDTTVEYKALVNFALDKEYEFNIENSVSCIIYVEKGDLTVEGSVKAELVSGELQVSNKKFNDDMSSLNKEIEDIQKGTLTEETVREIVSNEIQEKLSIENNVFGLYDTQYFKPTYNVNSGELSFDSSKNQATLYVTYNSEEEKDIVFVGNDKATLSNVIVYHGEGNETQQLFKPYKINPSDFSDGINYIALVFNSVDGNNFNTLGSIGYVYADKPNAFILDKVENIESEIEQIQL